MPGTACGILQRGLSANPSSRIVLLEQPLAGPFEPAPAGFVVIHGAPLSHAMIPLLGSGVPTVIITPAQAEALHAGRAVALDGASGLVTTDTTGIKPVPTPAESAAGCATADGVSVQLRVSARNRQSVRRAVDSEAESIGLVRSEFLEPADGRVPDTLFYQRAFRDLCESASGLPVTIRLFDVAADKRPAWLPPDVAVDGVLGRQGVRLYREETVQRIYRAQLEAIDALAGEFALRVLLPYVANSAELQTWCGDVQQRLSHPVPLGAMAETPAAALEIGAWLETADFVGIGCNDLMQCLFGADRDRPEVARYLDPYAPSLYRFLAQVAGAARERLDAVQLCGVLPQLPGILPILLGLGFRVFSVEANLLPWLVRAIAQIRLSDVQALAKQVCASRNAGMVAQLLGVSKTGHN
ncbi:MAG: phosphoenolpyruvate-protein phosphotransferase [Halobacteria archaeon]|nr:phosphoenolpyruvate-protein phosphotransferase [Halobacteria archaeon]